MQPTDPRIVELRQYTLHPDQRDALIDLFERHFIEAQQAAGIDVIGAFRDLDDADRFVWLRGFADMASRPRALAGFYGCATWLANRGAANATLIDSDNVLLLRHTPRSAGFVAAGRPSGCVAAHIWSLPEPADAALLADVEPALQRALAQAGAVPLACLATEASANNYPRLPVREGESVLVSLARFASDAALQAQQHRFERLAGLAQPTRLRLASTRRSRL